MPSSDADTTEPKANSAWRTAEVRRAGLLSTVIILALLSSLYLRFGPATLRIRGDYNWVGKRVVQKTSTLKLNLMIRPGYDTPPPLRGSGDRGNHKKAGDRRTCPPSTAFSSEKDGSSGSATATEAKWAGSTPSK